MNLPTLILRQLDRCRHAMLDCEIATVFPARRVHDLARAVQQLRAAKLIVWTSQGWLITEAGIVMAGGASRLSFGFPGFSRR